MPKNLKRYYGQGHLHFLTWSCYRRKPLLGSVRARNRFLKILDEVRQRYHFRLVGYVVMPEHVHLLVSEPELGTPSTVVQVIKQRFSRLMRRRKRKRSGAQLQLWKEDEAPRFWQRRFYDFNVWSEKKKGEKLNYMHNNPVKRKLVTHPKQWPWSSFSFYFGRGPCLLKMDPV
jgi:putative transposase